MRLERLLGVVVGWLIDAFEQDLRESLASPEQLRARACELRKQADEIDIKGVRDASPALAARHEEAAEVQLSTR